MKHQFTATTPIRLDLFLTQKLQESRNQIDHLIKKDFVRVENRVGKQKKAKSGLKLQVDDQVFVQTFEESFNPTQQYTQKQLELTSWYKDIKIIYEDEHMMVLDKPSSVIVHGAPSVSEPTLVDWLKIKDISLSTISGEQRHGIVHRLDKGTSGLMVIAKNNQAHENLSKQLQDKSMGRYYLAFIDPPLKENITIEKPIGRNRTNRLKMGIVENGKYAKTNFLKIDTSKNGLYELIAAKLFTGRTHQIRVHLESLHRHILGDSLYGFKGNFDKFSRVYLHAYGLYLNHPVDGQKLLFCAPMPEDMKSFYFDNFIKETDDKKIDLHNIIDSFHTHF
jgi:23S rRNA pseudouridine1911/1915/1917 synthase